MEVYISPLSPLNFTDKTDIYSGDMLRYYVQQFIKDDEICIEIIGEKGLQISYNIKSDKTYSHFAVDETYSINDELSCYLIYIQTSDLSTNTLYSVDIIVSSETDGVRYLNSIGCFEVLDECNYLKKIEYWNSSNINAFNSYFLDNGNITHKFSIRIPCGFKASSYNENAAIETFRNQNQEIKLLYAYPYTQKELIIGDGQGVPYWIGRLINYIFCLDNVYIDGEKYVRSEDSTINKEESINSYPFNVYTMTVERYYNDIFKSYDMITKGDYNNDFNNDFNI